ncbi:MAG: zinc-ribbon domain-containing protein [Bacteroidales bacterium]|nr:zinc-ribbon domain-containing protein [Bacteroidales bacterium]
MVYCTNCGQPLDNGVHFCPSCGTRVRACSIPALPRKVIKSINQLI